VRLLVCGGRDYRDKELVWSTLDAAVHYADCKEIICGYSTDDKRYQGADQLAWEWAVENDFPCITYPAQWSLYGRGAGPRRNSQMADAKPDECVAFPRANGEWGAGTLDMISKAARAGAQVHRVTRPPTSAASQSAEGVPARSATDEQIALPQHRTSSDGEGA
jgi:hypothetical protein